MIDKQYPGIGATTLELEDGSRNSIIVFPTRALAATKAKGKKIHYVGSNYPGVKTSTITEISSDIENGGRVKIAVVADSLIKLYDELSDSLHASKFYIVLDEIDSFQTESNYRPKLEECIDIYLDFPPERRCLVSATLEQFSDRRLRSEPRTIMVIDNYEKQKVRVINATQSVIKVAIKEIEAKSNLFGKVFIAFNTIDGILQILRLLPADLVAQSGILCSNDSLYKIQGYQFSEIKDGLLEHKITFFTSAYFVGIDVLEQKETVHSIIIADTSLPVSLISISKIKQVYGRIRNGAASATLILNGSDKSGQSITSYNRDLDQRQMTYESVLDNIHDSFKSIGLQEEGEQIQQIMLDTCKVDNVCLLRKVNDRVVISASNIDHLKIRNESLKKLYSNFRNAVLNLSRHFSINQVTMNDELDPGEKDSLTELSLELKDEEYANTKYVIKNAITNQNLAIGKKSIIITQIWKEASNLIDQDKVKHIIEALPTKNEKELNKILFQVRLFSEKEDSYLWKQINLHFAIGQRYTSDEIHKNIYQIMGVVGYNKPFVKYETLIQSKQKLNLIFETKPRANKTNHKSDLLLIRTLRYKYCK